MPGSIFPWFLVDQVNRVLDLKEPECISVNTIYLDRYLAALDLSSDNLRHLPPLQSIFSMEIEAQEKPNDSVDNYPQSVLLISLPGLIEFKKYANYETVGINRFWGWLDTLKIPDSAENDYSYYFDCNEIINQFNKSDNITFSKLAEILTKSIGRDIEENELIEMMYKDGFLLRKNDNNFYPTEFYYYQKYLGIIFDDFHEYGSYHVYVTPKGKDYFIHYYMNKLKNLEG